MSVYSRVWSHLRRDRKMLVCLAVLGIELLCVLLLPPLLGLEPNATDQAAGFEAHPSREHWLGTDDVGRDVFSRLVCGGRVSLLVGGCSAAISLFLGVFLGLLAGYRRGGWEFWIMRCADVFQSFPSLVLILCLVTLLGASMSNLILVIGFLGWPSIARLVYGNTVAVREKEYILAVRALGARTGTILWRNVLPNTISPIWAALGQRVGRAILSESSLSFLGMGIRPPQASWGNMIQQASQLSVLTRQPWIWLPPGILIILTVVCLQVVGDGLRDALDPKFLFSQTSSGRRS